MISSYYLKARTIQELNKMKSLFTCEKRLTHCENVIYYLLNGSTAAKNLCVSCSSLLAPIFSQRFLNSDFDIIFITKQISLEIIPRRRINEWFLSIEWLEHILMHYFIKHSIEILIFVAEELNEFLKEFLMAFQLKV